jgi:hypothetical protein
MKKLVVGRSGIEGDVRPRDELVFPDNPQFNMVRLNQLGAVGAFWSRNPKLVMTIHRRCGQASYDGAIMRSP